MRAAARPVASVTTLCETGAACILMLPEPRGGLPWARSRCVVRGPPSGPAGRRDPTRIYKALEARLSVACISNAEAGAVACISNAACENPPPGCYLVVECPERWKASRRWARIFMRWHTASSYRVLSASIYARGCTDCMGACASYRRPTPSRAQGTVDPAGWKPRLPVRAKLKRSEPEAGGASLCLE